MEETPQDSYPEREVFLNDLNKELGSTTSPPLDVLMDQTEKPSNQVSFARRSVNAVVGGIKKVPDVLASSAEYVTQKIDRGPVAKVIDFLEGVPKKYQGKIAEDLKRKIETIKHFYAENSSDEFLRKLAPLSDIMPPEDYQRLMGEANNIIHDEEKYNLKAKVNTAFAPDPFSSRTREQEVANTQPPEELPYPAGYNTPEPPPVYVAPPPFPETQPEPPPLPEVVPPPIVESVSPVEPSPFPQEKTPAYGHSVSEVAKLTSPYERDRFDDPEFIKEKESWKTPDRTVVPKVMPVGEKPVEKVFEVPSSIFSSLENLLKYLDDSPGIKSLIYSLKKGGVTKESATQIIQSSNVLNDEWKNSLIEMLGGVPIESEEEQIPEASPVIEQKEVFSGELPYPDGYVPQTPSFVKIPDAIPVPVEDPAARLKSLNQRVRESNQKNAPYTLSRKSAYERYKYAPEQGPTRKEDLSPEEFKKIESELRDRLDATRGDFVRYEAEYKQELRKKKKIYRRIMEDLGAAEKQLPNMPEKDPEHVQAEDAYLDAQWVLYNFITGRETKPRSSGVVAEGVSGKKIDIGAANQADSEWDILQRKIIEATPVKERSVILSAFAKWNSYPLPARIALSTALLTVGGITLTTLGVSGVLANGALRFGRALAGAQVGLAAGKWFDGIKRKEIEKKRSERLDQHGTDDESVNTRRDKQAFIEKNKEFARGAEEEKKTMQKNQLVKAGIMAAAGGVTTVGLGLGLNAVENISSAPGVKVNPEIETASRSKSSWLEKLIKKDAPVEQAPTPKVPVLAPEKITEAPGSKVYITPVEVDLSSKGFIDTVDQLKKVTAGKPLTPSLENLLSQSPQKIAMDLGLFQPGQVEESAFGLQGEQLAIDSEGNLNLVRDGSGETEVLMDSKGTLKPYAGKMFDADKYATSPMPADTTEVPVAQKVAEVIPETAKSVVEVATEKALPVEIKSLVGQGESVADGVVTESALIETKSIAETFDGKEFASPAPEFERPDDIVKGLYPLKKEYQFGAQYEPQRKAYNMLVRKQLMFLAPETVDAKFAFAYQKGGMIDIFQKGNDITMLLNGEKIGTASLFPDGKIDFQYESKLGKGMLGVKSDYEQAFDFAKGEVEKNKKFFKVSK